MPDVQPIFDWLQANPGWTGWLIFFIAFFESLAVIGLIVPGVVLLFGIAAIAGNGVLDVWSTLGAAFFGAVLGDGLSFFIGHYFHQHIKDFWPFRSHPQWIENGEQFFQRHGGKSIILGRFIGPIRPFIPMVAGMLDMPTSLFIFTNVLSAIGWAPVYLLPGYYIGSSLHSGDEITRTIMIWILFGTLVGWALLWAFRRTSQQLAYGGQFYQRVEIWAQTQDWRQAIWLRYQQRNSEGIPSPKGWFPLGAVGLFVLCGPLLITLIIAIEFELSSLAQLDLQLRELVQELRSAIIEKTTGIELFFEYASLLGDYRVAMAALCLLTIIALKIKNRWIAIHGWAIAFFAALVALGLKGILQVVRPTALSAGVDAYSFPSGHTVSAVVLFGFGSFLINQFIDQRHHWKVYLTATIPVLLTAVSRLYLDVHWLSDVVGSGLVGLMCCAITAFSFHRFSGDFHQNNRG